MVMFHTALTVEDIAAFMLQAEDVIILPKPGINSLGVVTGDGRPCLVQPTSAPTPGNPGSPPGPCKDGCAPDPNANYSEVPEGEVLPLDLPDPIDTGSDQAQCKMLGESVYNKTGEGFVLSQPGDFTKTAKPIVCPAGCLQLTGGS